MDATGGHSLIGRTVEVNGLATDGAGASRNGTTGIVVSYAPETERCEVRFDSDGAVMKVRGQRLTDVHDHTLFDFLPAYDGRQVGPLGRSSIPMDGLGMVLERARIERRKDDPATHPHQRLRNSDERYARMKRWEVMGCVTCGKGADAGTGAGGLQTCRGCGLSADLPRLRPDPLVQ